MTCYSSGPRVSEVVALKISVIDSNQIVINIRCAKYKKDWIVALSQPLLERLKEYFKKYKPREFQMESLPVAHGKPLCWPLKYWVIYIALIFWPGEIIPVKRRKQENTSPGPKFKDRVLHIWQENLSFIRKVCVRNFFDWAFRDTLGIKSWGVSCDFISTLKTNILTLTLVLSTCMIWWLARLFFPR